MEGIKLNEAKHKSFKIRRFIGMRPCEAHSIRRLLPSTLLLWSFSFLSCCFSSLVVIVIHEENINLEQQTWCWVWDKIMMLMRKDKILVKVRWLTSRVVVSLLNLSACYSNRIREIIWNQGETVLLASWVVIFICEEIAREWIVSSYPV